MALLVIAISQLLLAAAILRLHREIRLSKNSNQKPNTMFDLAYLITSIGFSALMIVFIKLCEKSNRSALMENLIVGIIAFGLIVYLIFTIIRPEKF